MRKIPNLNSNNLMVISDINIFYDQYVDGVPYSEGTFTGHFDYLLWKDLQKDLSACERLQRKPFYKIALVHGNATYQSKSKKIDISGNSIIFSDPMARFTFETKDEQFVGKYCVCSDTFLRSASRISLTTLPVFQKRDIYVKSLSEIQYDELMLLFNEIDADYKSSYPFREQLIRNRIFDIIHYVQKMDKTLYENVVAHQESIEDRFLKILENTFFNIGKDNMLESKSPSYYAGLLNVTVDQLNKIIKNLTGKTTQAIIHERIIEEANVLLKHGTLSIKEIGWRLHFQETSHFQNFYKRQVGCTPMEFRKG